MNCWFLVKEEDKTLGCDLGHFAPPDPRWKEMLPAESIALGWRWDPSLVRAGHGLWQGNATVA